VKKLSLRLRTSTSCPLLLLLCTITSSFFAVFVCSTATFRFLVSTSEEYFSSRVFASSTISCRSYSSWLAKAGMSLSEEAALAGVRALSLRFFMILLLIFLKVSFS
jgi:hypothetical protein